MRRFLRPSCLLALLAVVAGAVVWWVYQTTQTPARPTPLPVASQDREIAWLNAATGLTAWQRFVQGVVEATGVQPDPEKTFPRLTTAVPEIAVPFPGKSGHLRIRWYKVTGEWNTHYWVHALTHRDPPPLAIIGGNSTERATEQASRLREETADLEESRRPLLLLTFATADRVSPEAVHLPDRPAHPDGIPLVDIYPGRTFRFCFSNLQMSDAVTSYIWAQSELRPDAFPIYTSEWEDDAYSRDLVRSFLDSLQPYLRRSGALAAASEWGLLAGLADGGFPLSLLRLENDRALDALAPRPNLIPFSVGHFDRPNRYEAEVAQEILDDLGRHPRQRRTLLVLSGQVGPSRRLVRAMCRLSPMRTRRCVLAAGDTIAFNTVLRDRNVAWPIQDLPCSLVFFCHNNPLPDGNPPRMSDSESGHEDLRLYKDLARALVLAGKPASADDLRNSLKSLRLAGEGIGLDGTGVRLFDAAGNRTNGTGEHVVWLKPSFTGERAHPQATITVVAWQPDKEEWKPRGEMPVAYTGAREREP